MARGSSYGRGSIRAKGEGRWELRVSAGRDVVTGKPRYVSRSVKGSKRQAEAALAELLVEVQKNAPAETEATITIAELVEQWLELRRDRLSVTTWEGYAGKARFRLVPVLGEVKVTALSVRDIDRFYQRLAHEDGLSPSTVKQIHNVLVGSLDQAVRWGMRPDNPARLATLPRPKAAEVRAPTPADVMAAIAAADQELGLFVRLSAAVGARRGEVSALRWSNIDLDGAELVITRALVETADRVIHEKDPKTHQARRVALDAGTVSALRDWRTEVEARAAACEAPLPDTAFVFSPSVDGTVPWRPFHWTSAWRRLRVKAGIDESIRLHDLRHFAATRLLDAGVPVKTVSGRLGHARPATTLNIYAHFVPATDRLAADAMGDILGGTPADS